MKSHLQKFKQRPLSWSSISSFKYNKEQWARKYLLGIVDAPNKQMEFGKRVGELIAHIPDFLLSVPRYTVFEKELRVKLGSINLIGFLDSYDPETHNFYEFKTTSNDAKWTKKSVDEFGQISMYIALLWLQYDVPPEKISCSLVSIPVEETGDFKIKLSKKPIKIFETKRTKIEILNFLIEVKKIYNEMCQIAINYKLNEK